MTHRKLLHALDHASGQLRAEVGISVDSDGVRMVVVRRGRMTWSGEMALDGASGTVSIGQCLATLFERAHREGPRLARNGILRARAAHLSLSPPACRVKRLGGLPQPCPDELLERIVKTNVSRFFIGSGVTSGSVAVYQDESDRVWGAAFDSGVVQTVAHACAAAGVRLRRVVPASACMEAMDAGAESGASTGVVRDPRATEPEGSVGLAEAVRAARDAAANPFVVRLGWGLLDKRHARNILWLASAVAVLLTGISITLPALHARYQADAATSELRVTSRASARALKAHGELAAATDGLELFANFAGGRRSMLSLISQLSIALPEDAAMLNVRLTHSEGTLTVIAVDVSAAAAALENARDVARAEIVGLVTRATSTVVRPAVHGESGSGEPEQLVLERATIRLALRAIAGTPHDHSVLHTAP